MKGENENKRRPGVGSAVSGCIPVWVFVVDRIRWILGFVA